MVSQEVAPLQGLTGEDIGVEWKQGEKSIGTVARSLSYLAFAMTEQECARVWRGAFHCFYSPFFLVKW